MYVLHPHTQNICMHTYVRRCGCDVGGSLGEDLTLAVFVCVRVLVYMLACVCVCVRGRALMYRYHFG